MSDNDSSSDVALSALANNLKSSDVGASSNEDAPSQQPAVTMSSQVKKEPETDTNKNGPSNSGGPMERASNIRERVGKRLKLNDDKGGQVNYDVEKNIQEVQAILSTNSEIFDRCMRSQKQKEGSKEKEGWTTFTRHSFDEVEAYTEKTTTHFVSSPRRSEKSFATHPLLKLPAGLDDIFICAHRAEPFSMHIDYESFFEKSLILHEDILGAFLAKLKEHLMSVQVCLGAIDNWILEPMNNINYLKEIFGGDMSMPAKISSSPKTSCKCPSGRHSDSTKCLVNFTRTGEARNLRSVEEAEKKAGRTQAMVEEIDLSLDVYKKKRKIDDIDSLFD